MELVASFAYGKGGKSVNMGDGLVLNVEKALDEKKQMQKIFVNEHGYPSTVLEIVIEHLEGIQGGKCP